MSEALDTWLSACGGADARGLNLRALDQLGMRRLATDSRRVKRGDTFVAYPGQTQDGRRYVAAAIANGASSVLWEKRGFRWKRAWRVPNLGIVNLRARAGLIASRIHDHPSARLWMIGVTGTNGKTSCSHWIARALSGSGLRCAVIGTLGYGLHGRAARKLKPLANTTPDAVWLHAQLAALVRRGARAVSMEVSSIGLDQDRIAGVQFDVALFTNLTRDHLDYHRTMRRYETAKTRLFECKSLKYAIINLDDEFGVRLAKRVKRRGLNVIGYGFGLPNDGGAARCARVTGSNLVADARGVRFDVVTPWGRAHVASSLLGHFNASNLLGTLAVLLASGVGLRKAVAALARVAPVAGRMQAIGGGTRPVVVVDYAHTPDALEQVLLTLRALLKGFEARVPRAGSKPEKLPGTGSQPAIHVPKLICVFGCGGGRDRGKRRLMGRVASRLADRVVLTNDNPRNEAPLAIIEDILADGDRGCEIELDRRRAIKRAIQAARRGDVVLIAGKGHETYQEVKGVRRPFSDIEVARAALVAEASK
jgi:UDP-N-acetylmuramoyl-L-alanyl-D-glutamate--2,6-diaminopimelate ligase